VLVAQHLFDLKSLQVAPANEGTQDAFAQGGLYLCQGIRINAAGWVVDDARRGGVDISIAHYFLKHSIDHADMEMHMFVQAGTETVEKGHRADMQRRLVRNCGARAVNLAALRKDPQKDAQHHIELCTITLRKLRSRFGTDSTHWRTGMRGKT
jgi:hypothetical protein